MAFMDQKRKAQLAPGIKAVLRKYGLKGSLRVRDHASLNLTLTEGSLDLIGNAVAVLHREADTYPHDIKGNRGRRRAMFIDKWMREAAAYMQKTQFTDVNTYHAKDAFTGVCQKAILELIAAMNVGNHDESDPQTDYFNVGWYIHVNVGQWNKPYRFTGANRKEA